MAARILYAGTITFYHSPVASTVRMGQAVVAWLGRVLGGQRLLFLRYCGGLRLLFLQRLCYCCSLCRLLPSHRCELDLLQKAKPMQDPGQKSVVLADGRLAVVGSGYRWQACLTRSHTSAGAGNRSWAAYAPFCKTVRAV